MINFNKNIRMDFFFRDGKISINLFEDGSEKPFLKKGYVFIHDNVNGENYSKTIDGELFSGMSYIWINENRVKIFQKALLIDDIYYQITKEKIVISNFLNYFKNALIDKEMKNIFLETGVTPPRRTILKNIYKLLPGELLDLKFGRDETIKSSKKWLLPIWVKSIKTYKTIKNPYKVIDYLLTKNLNIEEKLSKNKKIGILLSGGIDSGIIAMKLEKITKIPKVALTGWYESTAGFNELKIAKLRAKQFKIEHKAVMFEKDLFNRAINESLIKMDAPLSDSSTILESYLGSVAIKENIRLLFNGEIADTFFGGGNTFMVERYSKLFKVLYPMLMIYPFPSRYKKKLGWALSESNSYRRQLKIWFGEKVRVDALEEYFRIYEEMISLFEDSLVSLTLFQAFIIRIAWDNSKIRLSKRGTNLFYCLPFQTLEMLQLAVNLEDSYKINNFRSKYILRKKYGKLLKGRKVKQSFKAPVLSWIDDYYLKNGIAILNGVDLEKSNEKGFGVNEGKIWRHYILNRWYERFDKQ